MLTPNERCTQKKIVKRDIERENECKELNEWMRSMRINCKRWSLKERGRQCDSEYFEQHIFIFQLALQCAIAATALYSVLYIHSGNWIENRWSFWFFIADSYIFTSKKKRSKRKKEFNETNAYTYIYRECAYDALQEQLNKIKRMIETKEEKR